MNLAEYAQQLPKVETHVHLIGTVSASTYVELAGAAHLRLPPHDDPAELYERGSIYRLIEILDNIARAVTTAEDMYRITYESQRDAAESGVRYREMSWNPTSHRALGGMSLVTQLEGLRAAVRDAEVDFGIMGRMIAAVNRTEAPGVATDMIKELRPLNKDLFVIAIGMDYPERDNPPGRFRYSYELAAASGMHRTAHACEDAPPSYAWECLDILGCERLDHGYWMLHDDELVERCVDEGVVVTVAPTASYFLNSPADRHPIRLMFDRGLKLTINTDDPTLHFITPAEAYRLMLEWLSFSPQDVGAMAMNSLDSAWMDEQTKRTWAHRWSTEIAELIEMLGVLSPSDPLRPMIGPGVEIDPDNWPPGRDIGSPPWLHDTSPRPD